MSSRDVLPRLQRAQAAQAAGPGSGRLEFGLPTFERATVGEAMNDQTFTCDRNATLREAAQIMASHLVHCLVVLDEADQPGQARAWALLSAHDLVRAAAEGADDTAGHVAGTEVITVEAHEPLARAAQLMNEHETSHLVVVDATRRPVGVISTLDVADVLAWGSG